MSGLLSGILALVLVTGVAGAAVGADGLTLYVAPNGNDAWSGTRAKVGRGDGPFATLERARDAVRLLKKAGSLPAGGVTVEVAAGTYELARPLELGEEDSGTEAAPVAYRAKAGAEVRLVGGKQVTNFQPCTDPSVLRRLNAGARGKVMQADLKALGVTDFGDVAAGGRRLELFYDDRPMSISRWPNEGFVRIVDLVGGAPHKIHGIPGDKIGKFTYADDRPKRWAGEKDVWLHGYWFWDWSDQRQRVESIDTEKRVITLEPPYHTYGYRKNQWYYAFNLLPELDTPGEYHVDREAGILYFWPPAAAQNGGVGEREKGRRGARALSHSPKALVSILPALINTKHASHVTFRGFTLEATRSTAVMVAR